MLKIDINELIYLFLVNRHLYEFLFLFILKQYMRYRRETFIFLNLNFEFYMYLLAPSGVVITESPKTIWRKKMNAKKSYIIISAYNKTYFIPHISFLWSDCSTERATFFIIIPHVSSLLSDWSIERLTFLNVTRFLQGL